MADEDLTRRERQKQAHRREILDAALVLFSERGFHAVSMQQVAERADFSIGTLYNYFENKEDIYRTLVDEMIERFGVAITAALEVDPDPVAKLRNYVAAMGRVVEENQVFLRFFHREMAGVGAGSKFGFHEEIRRRRAEFLDVLAGVFADGVASGLFRPVAEPRLLALALDGLVRTVLTDCLENPGEREFPEDPDALLSVLFQGLLAP